MGSDKVTVCDECAHGVKTDNWEALDLDPEASASAAHFMETHKDLEYQGEDEEMTGYFRCPCCGCDAMGGYVFTYKDDEKDKVRKDHINPVWLERRRKGGERVRTALMKAGYSATLEQAKELWYEYCGLPEGPPESEAEILECVRPYFEVDEDIEAITPEEFLAFEELRKELSEKDS